MGLESCTTGHDHAKFGTVVLLCGYLIVFVSEAALAWVLLSGDQGRGGKRTANGFHALLQRVLKVKGNTAYDIVILLSFAQAARCYCTLAQMQRLGDSVRLL
jgi:hypothetical protein